MEELQLEHHHKSHDGKDRNRVTYRNMLVRDVESFNPLEWLRNPHGLKLIVGSCSISSYQRKTKYESPGVVVALHENFRAL